ncbi:GTP pyrophosphokinase [Burkholderia lata]|uniref:GTP pyrophosphokinase n=1 Tax=Burkholderia lata (strain ATCC 17760 / DSM 23089 / LMG 22485 / NCIMB 9086 / R18194 / 383) TaxID=482957 RepID=UPI001581D380|nr:(p)ppGpp synthetase [Burkholderia lata]
MNEYDAAEGSYRILGKKLTDLMADLLDGDSIRVHSVTFRRKERDSLEKKIASKPSGKYACLADITDICGLRIVTYFEDDVARVEALVRREFSIDEKNYENKSAQLDDNEFGYRSVHHIVSLGDARRNLPENKKIKSLKAEVQIRSILQHAWAEIEHDLGYKFDAAVPKLVRRRFYRLAGLFELADQEFMTIRDQLTEYAGQLPSEIVEKPAEVTVDMLSLSVFVEQSAIVADLDREIANIGNWMLVSINDDMASRDAAMLRFLGIITIDQVVSELTKYRQLILDFARAWINRSKTFEEFPDDDPGYDEVKKGIVLMYLSYVKVLSSGTIAIVKTYVNEFFDGDVTMPERLMEVFKSVVDSRGA